MKTKELEDLVDRKIRELIEHCDSVQIFITTRPEGTDLTESIDRGAGNWYARFGQVKEWVVAKEHCIKLREERDELL